MEDSVTEVKSAEELLAEWQEKPDWQLSELERVCVYLAKNACKFNL